MSRTWRCGIFKPVGVPDEGCGGQRHEAARQFVGDAVPRKVETLTPPRGQLLPVAAPEVRTQPAPVFFVAPEFERHVGSAALHEWRARFKLTSKHIKIVSNEHGTFSTGVTTEEQGVGNVFR